MKFSVGDKVKIKSLDWFNEHKTSDIEDDFNSVSMTNDFCIFNDSMSKYCGKEAIVVFVGPDYYYLNVDAGSFYWKDWMFEELEDIKQFEYLEVSLMIVIPSKKLEKLGNEGWEMCGTSTLYDGSRYIYYFKKEKIKCIQKKK